LIHVTHHQVLLQMLRQVQRGAEIKLIARTRTIRNVRRRIQAICILAYVHPQEAVRARNLPSGEHFPLGESFDAVCPTAHLIARDEGENDITWEWAACEE